MRRVALLGLTIVAGLAGSQTAQAQGILWSLPPDGTWVRMEGTLQQTEIRPDAAAGNLVIQWLRHVTIKSVGKEDAEFNGETVPCRWIEIKVVTGKESEAGIDPGPVGTRIVKALVPESRITGKTTYGDAVPVAYIPVVKGWRKMGEGPVEPINSNVLNIYPLLSPLMHYRKLDAAEGDEDPMVKLPDVTSAKKYTGQMTVESQTTRTENTGEFWAAENAPFGLAKWKVKEVRSGKDRAQSRDEFKPLCEVALELSAQATGADAQSEIEPPAAP